MKAKTRGKTIEVSRAGVTVLIRPTAKGDKTYFVVDYWLKGERKNVWRSSIAKARLEAAEAITKITNGETAAIDLPATARLTYLRAHDAVAVLGKPVDDCCREYVEAMQAIAGRNISLLEIVRDWLRRNADIVAKINVAAAAEKLTAQLEKDGKSEWRLKGVSAALKSLGDFFNGQFVETITPAEISGYLAGLDFVDRTKKNHRDVIGYFNRWLCLNKYLPKGTDWLDGVQNYSKRSLAGITIYTPEELRQILAVCQPDELPTISIAAFTAMRHSEICRLKWENIQISEKENDSFIEVLGGKNEQHGQARRLVPISDNLRAWLRKCKKTSGPVTTLTYEQSTKHLPHLVARAKVAFKRNAFRHSGISFRVAQTGTVPLIADERGNSPAVIRSNWCPWKASWLRKCTSPIRTHS